MGMATDVTTAHFLVYFLDDLVRMKKYKGICLMGYEDRDETRLIQKIKVMSQIARHPLRSRLRW